MSLLVGPTSVHGTNARHIDTLSWSWWNIFCKTQSAGNCMTLFSAMSPTVHTTLLNKRHITWQKHVPLSQVQRFLSARLHHHHLNPRPHVKWSYLLKEKKWMTQQLCIQRSHVEKEAWPSTVACVAMTRIDGRSFWTHLHLLKLDL